jgi:hypothetical protein
MLDVDTFLSILYVMVDDLCHYRRPKRRPGPEASLSESEIITLAIFARWGPFASERDFYRYAQTELRGARGAFPTLPDRSQFNRLVRSQVGLIEEVALYLAAEAMGNDEDLYQALHSSAMPVGDAKRRGSGWLAGYADIGWSNSIGWYEGFSLLTATDPTGVVTGLCFGAASTADQRLAETFFAVRASPNGRLISAGSPCPGPYVSYSRVSRAKRTTGGGGSNTTERSWSIRPNATPRRGARKPLRRRVASIRQVVETVYDKLFNAFGLWRERPHELEGLRAPLAARVALHNFCIWLNDRLGRPRLAFADLLGW